MYFTGWRGNIKETIVKGWWSLNTERSDKDVVANSGEQSRTPDEEVNLKRLISTNLYKFVQFF